MRTCRRPSRRGFPRTARARSSRSCDGAALEALEAGAASADAAAQSAVDAWASEVSAAAAALGALGVVDEELAATVALALRKRQEVTLEGAAARAVAKRRANRRAADAQALLPPDASGSGAPLRRRAFREQQGADRGGGRPRAL